MSNPYDPSYVPQYAGTSAGANDEGHLTALAICHYVWAGLVAFFGFLPGLYCFAGIILLFGKGAVAGSPHRETAWILVVMGGVAMGLVEMCAVLALLTGLSITKRRLYALVMVSAGLNCLFLPLGTALGIFTFIVMVRPSVKARFAR